jgi:hypothetical protein
MKRAEASQWLQRLSKKAAFGVRARAVETAAHPAMKRAEASQWLQRLSKKAAFGVWARAVETAAHPAMKRAEASQWLQRLNKKASFPAVCAVRDALLLKEHAPFRNRLFSGKRCFLNCYKEWPACQCCFMAASTRLSALHAA